MLADPAYRRIRAIIQRRRGKPTHRVLARAQQFPATTQLGRQRYIHGQRTRRDDATITAWFSRREMFRIFRPALVARYEEDKRQTAHVKRWKTGSLIRSDSQLQRKNLASTRPDLRLGGQSKAEQHRIWDLISLSSVASKLAKSRHMARRIHQELGPGIAGLVAPLMLTAAAACSEIHGPGAVEQVVFFL
ncbi:hypothetical protein MPH_12824 [Macrophomina phaseolina MS6]|uniref:Uncharacterized protein n=1 Tax=Macrophomina phaseolina (strain MS6) TaxID=1126212 RepID=K2R765_MACPH|nr:hypothetical protein MPH_12824 [Macrophomina phaseolina MS6]